MSETENSVIMEIEPPPCYEEALQMRRMVAIQETNRPEITLSDTTRPPGLVEEAEEEEEEEIELAVRRVLSEPNPPDYPTESLVTENTVIVTENAVLVTENAVLVTENAVLSPAPLESERRPLQSPRGQDQEQMYDICKDCLVMGFAGFKMPRILKHAWKMGLSYTTSTGVIGNWPRYLFLIVQSLLLLGGVLFAYFIGDIDLPDYKYIRISFLSAALLVNFVERFTYWCLHAATRRPDNGSWNFYSDIIRLFLTEVFIYIALSTTMYSVTFHPSYRNYFSPLENSTVHSQHVHYGISMVVAIAVVFFLTACLMRNFVVYSVVRTLLKARKRDDNSHAGSLLKWFLSGLCIHTTALSVLQILQLLFVGLIFHKNDLPSSSYVSVVAFGFLAEIVPVASWFLYFLVSLPMVEMLPIAMLIDSPPAYSRNNQINIQAVSSLFRAMYSRWTSCRGICINVLRPFGSPFSSFAYMVFFVGGGYNVYFLIYTSFFSESSVSLVLVGCIAIMILIGFNFPAFIYGLLACLFVPILLFLYLFSAWLFKLNLNTIDTYLQ